MGTDGRHVVKDLTGGTYFQLGPEESFLLIRLDGEAEPSAVCAAYEERFGEPLAEEDLADFVELAREMRLLEASGEESGPAPARDPAVLWALRSWPIPGAGPEPEPITEEDDDDEAPRRRGRQSLLFWRLPLFDPSWLFQRLEPPLRWVWTPGFLVASAVWIVTAVLLFWTERGDFVNQFEAGLGWRTIALAWLALAITTTCHEFAHGLTCKHYGGEVREVGFLLMYFIPCFYCNVSDAWLFPERWKRLWVTLAGGYCDLVLWAAAVFTWRVTQPGVMLHDFAWFVVSVCGVRLFLNLNPLIKFDGYYVLADLLGMSNLFKQARSRFKAHVRWLLWGAARPQPEPRGGILLTYGVASWGFSAIFLSLTIWGLATYFGSQSKSLGIGWTLLLGTATAQRLFRDFSKGEIGAMFQRRRGRAAAWALGAVISAVLLATFPVPDRVGGTFQIRPAARAELRSPVAGFLREVAADSGTWVSPGQLVIRLEIPDLESRLAQKRAELAESEAKLTLLKVGPRPEEVEEQRQRVSRARTWRDLAQQDLQRSRRALEQELVELEARIEQYQAELERANEALQRDRSLLARQALQLDRYRESEKVVRVATAQLEQAQARKRARLAEGTLQAEAELARRQTEAADAEAALRLLELGTRAEELDAELARRARIEEEIHYLESQQARLVVRTPVAGQIVTSRLRERIGQYFQEGDLIAEVEVPERVEAEITVSEQDVARVKPGQPVELKVRALPFQTFHSHVDRIAPVALRPVPQISTPGGDSGKNSQAAASSSLTKPDPSVSFLVVCRLDDSAQQLKTGMTGYARVVRGRTPLGQFLAYRALRLIRTEFWW
jgi:multidrug resistance efflux pump